MHPSELPHDITERMRVRRGRLHLFERLDVRRTALVVIDMQNDFCAPGGWTETVVKKDISSCKPAAEATQKLVAAARAAGVPLGFRETFPTRVVIPYLEVIPYLGSHSARL